LAFTRRYSSHFADKDVGLGFGWTHSLGWRLERGCGGRLRVWADSGTWVEFPSLERRDEVIGPYGWQLRRTSDGFVLDCCDGVFRRFGSISKGEEAALLTLISDWCGNRIALNHENGRLSSVIDSVGRHVLFPAHESGRIAALEVLDGDGHVVTFQRYDYDDAGNLIAAADADGHVGSYDYDHRHKLVRQTDRAGLSFHFRYDRHGRCVEAWGDYGDRADPALSPDVTQTLTDGGPARGIYPVRLSYHPDGYSKADTSCGSRDYFGNSLGMVDKMVDDGNVTSCEYDSRGQLLAESDGLERTHRFERDDRGRLLSVTDPEGRALAYERNERGAIRAIVNAAGARIELDRDERQLITTHRDPTGGLRSFEYDERGEIVVVHDEMGRVTRFTRDAHGNVARADEPGGAVRLWSYDWWGRCTKEVDPLGRETHYQYSLRGDLQRVTHPDGRVVGFSYDGEGHLVEERDPGGQLTRYEWGGFHVLCAGIDETGRTERHGYDREGNLVSVTSDGGSQHQLEYDGAGRLNGERFVDGRHVRYGYDAADQLVRVTSESGAATELEYGNGGDLICRRYDDGSADIFDYDVNGFLERAENSDATCNFERDARGRIVRETLIVDGETYHVDVRYDAAGDRVRRATSLRHSIDYRRADTGLVGQTILDESVVVGHERDRLGRETRRRLPAGGCIDSSFDVAGRLVRRTSSTVAGDVAPVDPGEPDWIGALPDDTTSAQRFVYDERDLIVEIEDSLRGVTRYERDAAARLLKVASNGGTEAFQYGDLDAISEATDGAPDRTYGRGGRLLRHGHTEYVWNDDGFLIEKREPAEGSRSWVYSWNGAGLLSTVSTPNGGRISFGYDAFARRVSKRVAEVDPLNGHLTLKSVTHFVWDRHVPVHEVTRYTDRRKPDRVRTYAFTEGGFLPIAEGIEELADDGRSRGRNWRFHLVDPNGTVQRVLDGTGNVVVDIEASAHGARRSVDGSDRSTPLGFVGQYYDMETGLCYNRRRYYDPRLGLFISADPSGIEGELNPYLRGIDPTRDADVTGRMTEFQRMMAEKYMRERQANAVKTVSPGDYTGEKTPAQLRAAAKARALEPGHRGRFRRARRDARRRGFKPNTKKCHELADGMKNTNPQMNGKRVDFENADDFNPNLKRADGKGGWGHHSVYMEPPDPKVYDPDQQMVWNSKEEFVAGMFENEKVTYKEH